MNLFSLVELILLFIVAIGVGWWLGESHKRGGPMR